MKVVCISVVCASLCLASTVALAQFVIASCARKALLGPQGVGFLWGREEALGRLEPLSIGGQSTELIDEHTFAFKGLPFSHEAGIINTAGVIGLGAALDFAESVGRERISLIIQELSEYFIEGLTRIETINCFSPKVGSPQTGIVSWTMDGHTSQTVADELFKAERIVTASGNHGAPLATKFLGVNGVTRLSIHCFNTRDELDAVLAGVGRLAARA